MSDRKEKYRHEWKYLLPHTEAALLKSRLRPVLRCDEHSGQDGYEIRSLYFDDYRNTAYEQKLMGVYSRKKWRIRIYDYSDDHIMLERKKKRGNYICKESVPLTREEYDRIMANDYAFLFKKDATLYREFYLECINSILRPKVIVDYIRLPLVMDEGTVRITFDSQISAAIGGFDIFDRDLPKLLAQPPEHEILEVKYTEYLPQLVKKLLPSEKQEFTAFSKYCACYDAAHHSTDLTSGISKSNIGWRY